MTLPSDITGAALVTGASSGIGRSLACQLAKRGFPLMLVGRDEATLRSAAHDCAGAGVRAEICAVDLAEPDAVKRIAAALDAAGMRVEILVNNAGFAVHGPVAAVEAAAEEALVQVQILATLRLTRLALRSMLPLRSGRILHVASVYSFIPVPHQAVYGACKAFMFSHAAALREELRGTGVTASLLAPGTTRTAFRSRAGLSPRAERGGMDPDRVAAEAVEGLMAGRFLIVPGLRNKLLTLAAGLVPRPSRARVMGAINARRGLGGHGGG